MLTTPDGSTKNENLAIQNRNDRVFYQISMCFDAVTRLIGSVFGAYNGSFCGINDQCFDPIKNGGEFRRADKPAFG